MPNCQTWKLTLAYDGTDYSGWQVQPRRRTIQAELADALEHVTGERIMPQGSGRTDAGVHALGQVASFDLAASIPANNLQRALNRTLPPAIRILGAEVVSDGFHARHDALRKTYEYRVFRGEICPPFIARYAFPLAWPLDLELMQKAAQVVVGEHDFTSFAAVDPDLAHRDKSAADSGTATADTPNNIRTILASDWHDHGDQWAYRVTGTGFLHHMVRNLVGTFLEIGRGHFAPNAIQSILAAHNRAAAGPTARACGLYLVSVEYPAEKLVRP
jgi:tRNA pseudouridine38-40 synthase